MTAPRLNLGDLRELCDRYVPARSRHRDSIHPADDELWWHAHELGHLLTVDPSGVGEPMFGLRDGVTPPTELVCRELAAIDVSRRLLASAARSDLARAELKGTDYSTVGYPDRGRVRRILRKHRAQRLPRTRASLERRLRQVVAAARGSR